MQKVVASLDGGLTREEEEELLVEVRHHECCLDHISIARCYKTFLAQKVQRQSVSLELIEGIKARIASEGAA